MKTWQGLLKHNSSCILFSLFGNHCWTWNWLDFCSWPCSVFILFCIHILFTTWKSLSVWWLVHFEFLKRILRYTTDLNISIYIYYGCNSWLGTYPVTLHEYLCSIVRKLCFFFEASVFHSEKNMFFLWSFWMSFQVYHYVFDISSLCWF